VHHDSAGDFKHTRNSKKETPEQTKGKMSGGKERGLDYTPLYRFLLSKAGCDWDAVYSEAKSRLNQSKPIFDMVALQEDDKEDFIRTGESSYFSGMYVDDDGILQISNPDLQAKE